MKGSPATSTTDCELCGSPLYQDRCPACTGEERARFKGMEPGSFPATALPPPGLTQGAGLARLRRALANRELEQADELWAGVLRTVQPLGSQGRRMLADCFDAYACLKDAMGKDMEAERFRQRARSARKDPSAVSRHQDAGASEGRSWDLEAWKRLQPEQAGASSEETVQRVREQLERDEAAGLRRRKLLGMGGGGLAGLVCAAVVGLPALIPVLLGAGLGYYLASRA